MSDEDRGEGGFLARWSRRKRTEEHKPAGPADGRPGESAAPAGAELSDEDRQRIVEQLPDVDSLDAESDFTAFLRDGVPEELRERALRKLWRLDPVFANLDGLNDYDLDYTDAATVVENLKSAWRAGKGYASEERERPAEVDSGAERTAEGTAEIAEASSDSPPGAAADAQPTFAERTDDAAEIGNDQTRASDQVKDEPEPGVAAPTPSVTGGPRKPAGSAARRRWG